jgi:hypothetical protein
MADDEFFTEVTESEEEKRKREYEEEMAVQYRLVFKSGAGRRVLADILKNFCWYFSYLPPGDDKAIGERNVGLSILGRLGYGEPETGDIINAILNVPIEGEL